jgi:subtilisin-like proprotein convertase family protein
MKSRTLEAGFTTGMSGIWIAMSVHWWTQLNQGSWKKLFALLAEPARAIKAATLAFALAATIATASAQTNNYSFNFGVTNSVPDGNAGGMINQQIVTGTLGTISDLNVTISLSVPRNADLYAYLTYDGEISVLLNRVGVSSGNPWGYDAPGLSITLDDQAANNVHWYEQFSPSFDNTGQLLGTWQPDGRYVDPDNVNEFVSPTALLDRFNSHSANGTWTLFVADLSSDGEPTVLKNWSLELATTVPEPGPLSFAMLGIFLFWRLRPARLT